VRREIIFKKKSVLVVESWIIAVLRRCYGPNPTKLNIKAAVVVVLVEGVGYSSIKAVTVVQISQN
jgi:hypothetical protein